MQMGVADVPHCIPSEYDQFCKEVLAINGRILLVEKYMNPCLGLAIIG